MKNQSLKIFILFIVVLIFTIIILFTSYSTNKKFREQSNKAEVDQKESSNVIAAAADIACSRVSLRDDECRQFQTSELIKKLNPDAVLIPGDLQYESSAENFAKFYDASWGSFKKISFPVPGNHDYETQGAKAYFSYFGDRAGNNRNGYYSFDLGTWHIIGLNSNCWAIGGCQKGSSQESWLEADLKKNNSKCSLAFFHHPLFSSGQHGGNLLMKDIWEALYNNNVDIILNGHDHVYERFSKQNHDGEKVEDGIRQFTVGTGGRNLYSFKKISSNSEFRNNTSFGVLKLILHNDSYSWEFITTGSITIDTGNDSCL